MKHKSTLSRKEGALDNVDVNSSDDEDYNEGEEAEDEEDEGWLASFVLRQ